jgi:hypothetical protein
VGDGVETADTETGVGDGVNTGAGGGGVETTWAENGIGDGLETWDGTNRFLVCCKKGDEAGVDVCF